MNIKRTIKYGTNSAVLIVFVLTIAVLINLLVSQFDYKLDLTSNKLFSISKESVQIIDNIPANSKIQVYALFDDTRTEYKTFIEILNKYETAGKGKIEVIYKDPNKNPGLFTEIGYEKASQGIYFIVKRDKRMKALYNNDIFTTERDQEGKESAVMLNLEQSITGSLKYVTASETPTVYVTEGHNEVLTNGEFNTFANILQDNNFDLMKINLFSERTIPNDCKILIIASPKKDLTSSEKDSINRYLAKGGSAMFMFDGAETDSQFTNLQKVLTRYNIEIKNDIVSETDESKSRPDNKYEFLSNFSTAQINRELVNENIPLLLHRARSFKISASPKEGLSTVALVQTSNTAESKNIMTGQIQKGVQDIAIGSEYLFNDVSSRIVVVGDTDYLMDKTLESIGEGASVNLYSLVSWMNWLHEVEDDTIVAPKETTNKSFTVTASQSKVIFIFTVFILPLIIFILSIFVYLRRRHL